jgi:catechol 2,3-dioxygenase-like lactoylglutathione lyase family enzyme
LDALTPYIHVADVQRSVDFYRLLGLELRNSYTEDGQVVWAFVTSPAEEPNDARARLMLALADEPVVASQQAVLFYCWAPDLLALRAALQRAGFSVGEIEYPFYMPAGEFRAVDPDGYVLLVGQLGEPTRASLDSDASGSASSA